MAMIFGSYDVPAETDGYVFAFDRDYTVDVSPLQKEDRRAVPLEWVEFLAHETGHAVFATGNQTLKQEAEIPGTEEVIQNHDDLSMAAKEETEIGGHPFDRETRVEHVGELFDDDQNQIEYIVIDDVDLSHVDGWTHYYPWTFVNKVEAGDILTDIDLPLEG